MIDSAKAEFLQRKADEIYREAKDLRDFDRVSVFNNRLKEIKNARLRAGVEALAFAKLQLEIDVQPDRNTRWIETYIFSEFGAKAFVFLLAAATSFVEFRTSFLISLAIGLGFSLTFHIMMLFFYPRHPYRRLFSFCILSTITLIAPSSFEIEFKSDFARFLWGAPPSIGLIFIAIVCLLLSFVAAFVELRHSQKQ